MDICFKLNIGQFVSRLSEFLFFLFSSHQMVDCLSTKFSWWIITRNNLFHPEVNQMVTMNAQQEGWQRKQNTWTCSLSFINEERKSDEKIFISIRYRLKKCHQHVGIFSLFLISKTSQRIRLFIKNNNWTRTRSYSTWPSLVNFGNEKWSTFTVTLSWQYCQISLLTSNSLRATREIGRNFFPLYDINRSHFEQMIAVVIL